MDYGAVYIRLINKATSQALKNKLACLGRKYISKDGTKKKVRPEGLGKYLEQGWKLGQKH